MINSARPRLRDMLLQQIQYQSHRLARSRNSSGAFNNCVSREHACSLRTRPPEQDRLERFHADVAVTSAFNGLPSVVGLTAPLDRVPPTWRIKLLAAPVCRTGAVKRNLISRFGRDQDQCMKCCFLARWTSPHWSENESASNSGRFILSEVQCRNISPRIVS